MHLDFQKVRMGVIDAVEERTSPETLYSTGPQTFTPVWKVQC